MAWAQGTVNARTQAGDGTAITNTTAGRLDVTTQAAIQANAGTNLNTSALLLDATFTGRLPAAFSSADNIAAQTATAIHGLMLGWDGAGGNWDRLRVDASGNLNVNLNANAFGTLTVTANAGTNLNTSALLLDATFTGRINTLGQKAMAASTPVVLSSDQSSIPVTGTFFQATQPISATSLPLPTGASTLAEQQTQTTSLQVIDNIVSGSGANISQFGGSNVVTGTGAGGSGIPRVTVSSDSVVGLGTGSATIGAVTGTAANNSADSSLKLPTLPSLANAAAPSWTEGRQVPLSVDLAGNLRVNSTGGGLTDNSAFTAGSSTESPAGIVYNDTLATLNSGVTAAIRGTMYRAPYMTLMQGTGLETGTVQNPLNVNLANVGAIVSQSSLFDPRFSSTAQITTLDQWGNLKAVSTITDGTRVAALRGQEGAQVVDAGVVVHQSPAPALQCPFVQFISQTASTTLVTNGGKSWLHVCLFSLVSATAQSISLVEGTGTTCGTGTTALYGGTSASAALAANGGLHGISDRITLPMQKAGDNLCLLQSGAGNVSGTLVYGIY